MSSIMSLTVINIAVYKNQSMLYNHITFLKPLFHHEHNSFQNPSNFAIAYDTGLSL